MPFHIVRPTLDARIALHDSGAELFVFPDKADAPLYRRLKLITPTPWYKGRHTAFVDWIMHEQRFRKGGDAWLLHQHARPLHDWIILSCEENLPLDYLIDLYDWTPEQLAEEVARERAKYRK